MLSGGSSTSAWRSRKTRTSTRGWQRRWQRRVLEAAELLDEFLAERRLVGARLRELALEAVELLRRVLLVALSLLVRALQRRAQPLDLALGGGGALLVLQALDLEVALELARALRRRAEVERHAVDVALVRRALVLPRQLERAAHRLAPLVQLAQLGRELLVLLDERGDAVGLGTREPHRRAGTAARLLLRAGRRERRRQSGRGRGRGRRGPRWF